jgi:Rrf2 family iron-sulfur cluster assembly transcriptional regulator
MTVMRLTQASVYAIHALVYMARRRQTGSMPSHEIARAQRIPEKFLLKLLKSLAQTGVLRSVRGPGGGYRLARTPADISLFEILEAMDDPILGQVTPAAEDTDPRLDRRLEKIWEQVASQLRQYFAGVNLSSLAEKPKGARS